MADKDCALLGKQNDVHLTLKSDVHSLTKGFRHVLPSKVIHQVRFTWSDADFL